MRIACRHSCSVSFDGDSTILPCRPFFLRYPEATVKPASSSECVPAVKLQAVSIDRVTFSYIGLDMENNMHRKIYRLMKVGAYKQKRTSRSDGDRSSRRVKDARTLSAY